MLILSEDELFNQQVHDIVSYKSKESLEFHCFWNVHFSLKFMFTVVEKHNLVHRTECEWNKSRWTNYSSCDPYYSVQYIENAGQVSSY